MAKAAKTEGIGRSNHEYLFNQRNDTQLKGFKINKYRNPKDWKYREIQINTPLIEPSIKGHTAPFDNANGIGWIRVWINEKTGEVEVQEVQSDWGQKSRNTNINISNFNETKFLQDLQYKGDLEIICD